MTIEKIEMYQTHDGSRHNTVKDAKMYIEGLCCEALSKVLLEKMITNRLLENINNTKPNSRHAWTHSHILEIVEVLVGNYDDTDKLIDLLHKAMHGSNVYVDE